MSIACLFVIEGIKVLLDHEVDRTRRRIGKKMLEFLRVHGEMTTNTR